MANWGNPRPHRVSYGPAAHAISRLPASSASTPARPSKPANAAPGPSGGAPAASGLPLDPAYQAALGGLQSKRDSALAQYSGQRPRVLADYGYQATGFDSSGAPTGLAFDPNNPFSRASLLKRSYDQQQSGTQNSMAAHGQLYSGAREQAVAGNELGYQKNSDALQKALTSALVGITSGENAARTNYDIGSGQALGDSVTRALNSPLTPVPAVAAKAAAPRSAPAPAKPKPKSKPAPASNSRRPPRRW